MPEGPEVRGYYNYIKPNLLNSVVTELKFISGRYHTTPPQYYNDLLTALPLRVTELHVKGKTIFINLDSKFWMSFTHGMTGYWDTHPSKHARIQFTMDNGKLYYTDPRNFGRATIYMDAESYSAALDALGPDVMCDTTDFNAFYFRLDKKPKTKIGAALLDQKLVCGIGNYMRCDILWYSRIHYLRTIGSLTQSERIELFNAVKTLCAHWIEWNERESECSESESDDYTLIYNKDVDCYGNKVLRKTWLSRTIHYVDF
ncbi:hypothetical protein EB077_08755 [bacterium]|nr:hypothetical protein [bacterium]